MTRRIVLVDVSRLHQALAEAGLRWTHRHTDGDALNDGVDTGYAAASWSVKQATVDADDLVDTVEAELKDKGWRNLKELIASGAVDGGLDSPIGKALNENSRCWAQPISCSHTSWRYCVQAILATVLEETS
jgi:hypothetical protein